MIVKYFELKKKLNKHVNFYLLYGNNKGLIDETISLTLKPIFPKNVINYEENEILNKSETFYDSILNKSFFDNEKLIIIDRASDKILKIIEDIIEKKIDDLKIILTAGILEKKSKLRNFFEKADNTIIIPFYEDNNQSLLVIAKKFFKEKNINISQQNINLIIERSKGDRMYLRNEMEKISNFIIGKKTIDTNQILKLTNLAENYNVSELVDSCLAKNKKKTTTILNENYSVSEESIIILKTFLYKLKRLKKLQINLKTKKNIDLVLTSFKPPIFWKEKDVVKNQLKVRSLEQIQKLISNVNNLELLAKKNPNVSSHMINNFILENTNN